MELTPVTAKFAMLRVVVLVLVRVTICAKLEIVMGWREKSRLAGERLTVRLEPPIVPERATL